MQLPECAPTAVRLADDDARPTLAARTLPGSAPGKIGLRTPQLIRRVVMRHAVAVAELTATAVAQDKND